VLGLETRLWISLQLIRVVVASCDSLPKLRPVWNASVLRDQQVDAAPHRSAGLLTGQVIGSTHSV